jgi:sulfite reductase alpha subunit-like flavoprotein
MNGEPPDKCVRFFSEIKKDTDKLHKYKYAIFGLGNSIYEKQYYNQVR